MSGLFGAGPQVLVDDATGRVEYRPAVLPEQVAAAWFETLLAGIDWRQQRPPPPVDWPQLADNPDIDLPDGASRRAAGGRAAGPAVPLRSAATPPCRPAGTPASSVPAGRPADVLAECARVAVAAHEALGLRDLSRSDLIVRDDGAVWFLEVNVAPGFTETSLVPLSVEAAGLDLGEVLAGLVRAATARDVRTTSRPRRG